MDEFSGTFMGEKTIKRLTENISITPKQQSKASEWLDMMEKGELEGETKQYINFANIILNDILGYDSKKVIHNEDNVEYQYADASGEKILCIEAKGTHTKRLFDPQSRTNNAHRTPIAQTWDYMRTGDLEWGICTNYRYFALMKRNEKGKGYLFDFKDIKTEPEKLKEFIGIFSKKRLIDDGDVDNIIYESIIEQKKVGKEFYKLYHETRLMLIQSFTNENISNERAIYFTQIFLNRLIFIFFVQDKEGFLSNKHLFAERIQNLLNSDQVTEHSRKVYDEISELFIAFDKGSQKLGVPRFNGGLFSSSEFPQKIFFSDLTDPNYFKEISDADIVTKPIKLNKIAQKTINKYGNQLNPIIVNLLLLDSFDFKKEINEEVLGQIFEQSISDLEELKSNGISKRKTDGIFYTPSYITKFICMNTIIPYLSKTNVTTIDELINEYRDDINVLFEKFKQIKILDPACGSGAFLIQSIDVLLDIHKQIQYVKELSGNYSAGNQSLMTKWNEQTEIKTIIENNIHGVDVNRESIEITQLSLFLKLASSERPLTGLSKNIQNGNSILEDDSGFTWERNFPTIFNDPLLKKNEEQLKLTEKLVDGFDIVIGNPPYIRQELFKEIKPKLSQKYNSYHSSADMYTYFIEKGVKLLKSGGLLSFIVPNKFMKTVYGENLRKFLVNSTQLQLIYNFDDYPVFEDATTYTMIMTLKKHQKEDSNFVYSELDNQKTKIPFVEFEQNQIKFPQSKISSDPWLLAKPEVINLIEKLSENNITLKEFTNNKIYRGISTGRNDVFIIDKETKELLKKDSKANKIIKKIVTGTEVKRYKIDFQGMYILFIPWNYDLEDCESIKTYLTNNKDELSSRPVVKQGRFNWWALSRYGSTSSHLLSQTKIIYPRITNQCNFCIDESKEMYLSDNNFFISSDSKSLLALLNSKLIFFFMKNHCPTLQGGYFDFRRPYVEKIPIHKSLHNFDEVLSKNVSTIMEKTLEYQNTEKYFWSAIKSAFEPSEIDPSIKSIIEIDFDFFKDELNKNSKNPLDVKETPDVYMTWKKMFDETQKSLQEKSSKIIELEDEIDSIVFEMYGLTKLEIKIIEYSK